MEDEDDLYDGGNWVPPTDAELKVIAARRERQDKVSKLLGEYLLKGYKMLGTSCSVCETILMRSKQGVDYCVTCNELDSDTTKDDPALSSAAARSQAREGQEKLNQESFDTQQSLHRTNCLLEHEESQPEHLTTSTTNRGNFSGTTNIVSDVRNATIEHLVRSSSQGLPSTEVVNDALVVVHDQIAMATNKLKQSDNLETSRQLCQLIKDSAEAALCLRRLLNSTMT